MKTLFIILIIFSINLQAKDFSSVIEGEKSFFNPLKKGPKYINEALESMPDLNGESRKYANSVAEVSEKSFESQLKSVMVNEKQGKIVNYKEIDVRNVLNGNYIIKTYSVEFFGGKKTTIEIKYLRTIKDGGYEIVDAKFLE